MPPASRGDVLQSLKQQLRHLSRTDASIEPVGDVYSTGIAALDGLLPHRGISPGGMVEWLSPSLGMGAASLALAGVRAALSQGGRWVVIDLRGDFFPLAAAGWGVSLDQLLVLRPATPRDAAWAFEQTLRCVGVAVAWHWVDKASERALRRWKVAAEAGGGQGVLFRPLTARREASWADVRWQVQPVRALAAQAQPSQRPASAHRGAADWPAKSRPQWERSDNPSPARRLRVELTYCRGALGGQHVDLEFDDETGRVCLVASLAGSTVAARAARA